MLATVKEAMVDRAQEIGLFRWRVIGEAVDPSLSAREGVLNASQIGRA